MNIFKINIVFVKREERGSGRKERKMEQRERERKKGERKTKDTAKCEMEVRGDGIHR